MKHVKHNPVAAALRSANLGLSTRKVRVRKGKGSYQRRSKHPKLI